MKDSGVKSLVWVLLAVLGCSVNLVTSRNVFGTCEGRLDHVTVTKFVEKVGESMMRNYQYGDGFVFSGLKVTQKFLQLLTVSSDRGKNDLKRYVGLPQDTTCDAQYCGRFNDIIADMLAVKRNFVRYESDLYYTPHKSLQSGVFDDCFKSKLSNDFSNLAATRDRLGAAYSKFMGRSYGKYLDSELNQNTDFYMLSGLEVLPKVFNEYQQITSAQQFTNIEGMKKTVNWLKTRGFVHVVTKTEGATDVKIYRNDLNLTNSDKELHMVYFKPEFSSSADVMDKRLLIMDILKKLNEYISASAMPYGRGETLKSLTVPAMDLKTDADLAHILTTDMTQMLETLQVDNLYTTPDTLYEFRTLEHFYNKFNGDNKDLSQMSPNAQREDVIDSPFVFALVDVTSIMPLKVGVLMNPTQVY